MIKILTYILLFSMLSCVTPVRKGLVGKNKQEQAEPTEVSATDVDSQETDISQEDLFDSSMQPSRTNYNDRFEQIDVIDLGEVREIPVSMIDDKGNINFDNGFQIALDDFDKGLFTPSIRKFEFLIATLPTNDTLWVESNFLLAECYIQTDKMREAEVVMNMLLKSKTTTLHQKEKCYLRLGQLNCALGKEPKAKGYFASLKKEYPKSRYLKLADCKVIK